VEKNAKASNDRIYQARSEEKVYTYSNKPPSSKKQSYTDSDDESPKDKHNNSQEKKGSEEPTVKIRLVESIIASPKDAKSQPFDENPDEESFCVVEYESD
jgi:hypothetical protein